ncbi:MAG: hypothetical protein RBS80_29515 [Thermoguttaceae bacterium]|jgi:hypothetical protein|nr:hypothetical protein [Thermoguttaceae bacterium]
MEGSNSDGLTLDIAPSGRNGSALVTARLGDAVLACEQLNLAKSKARADFAAALAEERDGIDPAAIEAELMKAAAGLAARGPGDDDAQPHGETDYWAATPVAAKEAGQAMLESAGLVKQVADDVAALGVAGEREMVVTLYLVGTSRLLTRPLSAIVQGPSSSGKSYLIEKTAALFPPEAVIRATSMTPQALFYMVDGALEHRWVVAGERSRQQDDDATEATRALREMQSAGRLSKLLPIKRDGVIESVLIEREGPIAFVESTTLAESAIFDEDRNRALLLNTDEQTIQTRRIIDRLAEGYSGAGKAAAETIIARHHAAQRILERGPREVVIPFAQRLGELIAPERVEARRAFPQLCSMIQASALLHAKQRETDADGRLIATADDYKLCRYLLLGPLGRLLGGHLSAPAARFLERLRGRFTAAETFTKREAAAGDSASRTTAYGWLSELADADAIELVEPSRGRQPGTWRLAAGPAADAVLPAVEKVFPV